MKTLTQDDLNMIRDKAVSYLISYSPRCRLEGMTVDLTAEDKRSLAYLESCILVLNQLGVINFEKLKTVFPPPFTHVQETIWDGK